MMATFGSIQTYDLSQFWFQSQIETVWISILKFEKGLEKVLIYSTKATGFSLISEMRKW